MFEIAPAFAVPMVFCKYPEPADLNAELEQLFVAKLGEGDRYRNPDPFTHRNEALFESNFRLFDWPQECVQRLRKFCLSNVYRALRELNGYDTATLQRLHSATEAWFHVTDKGGFFGPHNHPMHSWSGVYCVNHPAGDEGRRSGEFTAINPFAMNTMYIDYGNANLRQPYHMGNRMLRLNAGELVLFPSWLLHEVTPYEGEGRRITVAFNCRFQLAGAKPAEVPIG